MDNLMLLNIVTESPEDQNRQAKTLPVFPPQPQKPLPQEKSQSIKKSVDSLLTQKPKNERLEPPPGFRYSRKGKLIPHSVSAIPAKTIPAKVKPANIDEIKESTVEKVKVDSLKDHTFHSLGLDKRFSDHLTNSIENGGQGFSTPTLVQQISFPAILSKRDCLVSLI